MNRVFVGVDRRQPLAYNVLQWSIHRSAKKPISVQPLLIDQLPITRRGLTDFTYARYLVPWLCDYEGYALFMDGDMLVRDGVDLNDLFSRVSMHDLTDKYSPTVWVNKEQPPFEWPSMMLFDCSRWRHATPDSINDGSAAKLDHPDVHIGTFSRTWNTMVTTGDREIPFVSNMLEPSRAKVLHFTEGIPCHFETQRTPGADEWHVARREMLHTVSWQELMGKSVHAKPVLTNMLQRYAQS